jgi:putative Holliday junction resolvase
LQKLGCRSARNFKHFNPLGARKAAKVTPSQVNRNMTLLSLDTFNAVLPPMRRLVGIDPGSKTVGLALSDVMRMVASPAEGIKRSKFTDFATHLENFMKAQEVCGIVVGLPLNMDGTIGPSAQSARQFAENLTERLKVPVALWDERLSTAAVERTLIEADLSRRRRAEVVDKLAATYILQGALDYLATKKN